MRAVAALVLLLSTAVGAQPPAPDTTSTTAAPAPPSPPGPADSYQRGTPRSAMHGFMDASQAGDWARAAQYLDLRRVPRSQQDQRGPVLARELKTVLDRTLWIEPETLSDDPAGERSDGAPPSRDLLGTITTAAGPLDLWIERVPREGDGVPIWKIASVTVAHVPQLYDEFGYGPWIDRLPEPLVRIRFLEVQLWQWIGFVVLALAAVLVASVIAWLIMLVCRPIARRTSGDVDDRLLAAVRGPLRLALALWLFGWSAHALSLAVPVQRFVDGIEQAGVIVLWGWLGLRLIDFATRAMAERLSARGDFGGLSMLPLGRRSAKVFAVGLAVIAALQNVGFNVTAILAGLGVGGLAVALAAQKTVENLFGGVILVADQPLRVGDLCRFGQQLGTVEDIGLRSTRIRTAERTIVTVPNAALSAMEIENLSRRDRIRMTATIVVRQDASPAQLRGVLTELTRRLRLQEHVDPDTVQVRLTRLGANGPEIDIGAYACTTDPNEFFVIREQAFLAVLDVLAEAGTGLSGKAA